VSGVPGHHGIFVAFNGEPRSPFPTGRKWHRQFDSSMYDFFLPVGKWLKMGLTCELGSELDY